MSVAARTMDTRRRAGSTGAARTRAAAPRARKPAQASRKRARAKAASAAGYRVACAAIVLVTAVAVARVAVTCQATEAAMDSGRLMEDIRGERLRADRLEIDKSSLAAPSRIESIAGTAMGMASPEDVRYLSVDEAAAAQEPGTVARGETPPQTDEGPVQAGQGSSGIVNVLDAIARVAAEQAQVLLVGDVGLATAR